MYHLYKSKEKRIKKMPLKRKGKNQSWTPSNKLSGNNFFNKISGDDAE